MSRDPGRQRRFYETREHRHLQPRAGDPYAGKLARTLVAAIGAGPADRVLEVGAGFWRFTFDLLDQVGSVVALDASPRALGALAETREARGIAPARCATYVADLAGFDPAALGERFGFIAGFFLLHHLPDLPAVLARLAALLEPGGALGFVEPNRRNPLFLLQVACCPDMPWAEEQGMFTLSARKVERAFRRAGLAAEPVRRFGFFPPQILGASALARRLEARLERVRLLEPLLPFLLLRCARRSLANLAD